MCGRNAYGADLMETQQAEPEFIPSLQDQHYRVAFFNAVCFEKVRCLIAVTAHLSKTEPGFAPGIAPNHGVLFRVFYSYGIDDIKRKVEVFRHIDFEVFTKIFV